MKYEREELLISEAYVKLITTIQDDAVDDAVDDSEDHESKTIQPYKFISKIQTGQFIENQFSNTSHIFPRNCRYFQVGKKNYNIIIEHEPRIRTIPVDVDLLSIIERHKINGKYEKYNLKNFNLTKRPYRFSLSFPYILYFISIPKSMDSYNMHIFFRLHPFSSFQDYLLRASLPNIGKDGTVCLGPVNHEKFKEGIQESVTEIIRTFWTNNFNNDLYPVWYENVPEVCDYFTWQHHTKEDPHFIYSTKWIPSEDTIGDFLKKEEDNSDYKSGIVLMNNFKRYVCRNKIIDKEKNSCIDKIRNTTRSLNIEGNIISIGDEIIKDGKKYYLYSLNSNYSNLIESADLEDEEGNISTISLVDGKKYLENKPNTIEQVTINNIEYKVGDVLFSRILHKIKILNKIIKLRDKTIQFQIGKDFYLENSLEKNFNKLDQNQFEINGIKIEAGVEYAILQTRKSASIMSHLSKLRFKKVKDINGEIILIFHDENEKEVELNYNDFYAEILKLEDLSIPPIYRLGEKLYTQSEFSYPIVNLIKNRGLGIVNLNKEEYISAFEINKYLSIRGDIIHSYLSSVIDEISIPSFDFDLNFKIGDEVIYADWENPAEMLKIKTIQSFSYEKTDTYTFNFNLIDDFGNVTKVPFITISISSALIQSGVIRKVCREINNIKIGTKAVATRSRITDFPKKDCNEIKAFIIDCEEPLVLFSNCRTIYFKSLEDDFSLIEEGDSKYQKLKNSDPNLEKIKLQCRDLIFKNKRLCTVNYEGALNEINYESGFHWSSPEFRFEVKNRYGILLPRFPENFLINLRRVLCFPGSRSNITKVNNSGYLVETRQF